MDFVQFCRGCRCSVKIGIQGKPHLKLLLYPVLLFLLSGCDSERVGDHPVAKRQPVLMQQGGRQWQDPYAYLSEVSEPATRSYVDAEREYLRTNTEAWSSSIAVVTAELNRDLPVERHSPAVISGQYEWRALTTKGGQYPVYTRRHLQSGETEVILDLNERALASDYYRLGGFATSPDNTRVAFTEDRTATGLFSLHVKNLVTGRVETVAEKAGPTLGWRDDRIVYLSGNQVFEMIPGEEAQILYEEADPAHALSIRSGGPDNTLQLISESHTTTDVRRIDTQGALQMVAERMAGHRYRVKFIQDRMVILSNLNHPDFEIALAAPGDPPADWHFISPGLNQRVVDFEPVHDGVYLHIREGMNHGISYLPFSSQTIRRLFTATTTEQLSFHTPGEDGSLRFWRYTPREPDSYWQVHPDVSAASRLYQVPVPPNYDAEKYRVERLGINARDGQKIPVTILYREGTSIAGRPVLMSAYGAYGLEQDLSFDPARLPLLRRGFILVWVHVRGGGELGARWREAGTAQNKKRSMTDFQDVARQLSGLGYGDANRMAARFASAGGVIGGYVINDSPNLLSVITMRAPFVDIVATLLDDSQPLTASDRLEWGDPRDVSFLDYQMSYSPYHQVSEQGGPDMLILVGASDRRVGMHESLKWLARLRYRRNDDALMLIDIQQNSGHLGATDQYLRRQQAALELVFIFNRLGVRI